MGRAIFSGKSEIDFENIAFVESRVGKVALPATIVFKRGTNVPANFAMLAERGASVSRSVGDDLGAHHGSERGSPVEIELSEKRHVPTVTDGYGKNGED